jgi:hypothetical protein
LSFRFREPESAGPLWRLPIFPGADLILCQITSRAHSDAFSVPLDSSDFERGQLPQPGFIRPLRLFTVEQHVILLSSKSDGRNTTRCSRKRFSLIKK